MLAAAEESIAISEHVQGLLPATVYRYRLEARSACHLAEVCAVTGLPATFTTQQAGGSFSLLDGRQWEMVSPPSKHGAGLEVQATVNGGLPEAAVGGGAVTYLSSDPITSEPEGNRSPELLQVLSRRGAGGWETQDLTSINNAPTEFAVELGIEYRAFSPDLSLALVEPKDETPLTGETSENTTYLRNDFYPTSTGTGGSEPGPFCSADCYKALITPANTPPSTKLDISGNSKYSAAAFVGGTPDLSHLVYQSSVPLTEEPAAKEGPYAGLYELADGQLQLVSILPGASKIPALNAGFGGNKRSEQMRVTRSPRTARASCGTAKGSSICATRRSAKHFRFSPIAD